VNQVSPTQSTSAGCIYCQAMNHVFEEYPIFLAHQMLPEHTNATFARPNNNPICKRTIPVGEISRISHGAKTPMIHLGSTSTISNHLIINKISQPSSTTFFQNPQMDTRFSNRERRWILSTRPKKHLFKP